MATTNGTDVKPSSISSGLVFLACNFSNKRVKGHFNELKKNWERNLPLRVYLSDQVKGEGARDLWQDITQQLHECNLAIFDVTSFRPNAVLELGFSLAIKQKKQIIICRDLTPSGRRIRKPESWLLSDIGHLFRIEYRKFAGLDRQLLENVERLAPVRSFYRLMDEVERKGKASAELYVPVALEILKMLRDTGPIRDSAFQSVVEDHGADQHMASDLLRRHGLAKLDSDGTWWLID